MERPRDALPEGTKLAGYVIRRVLGRGGFGMTYLGHDALFLDSKVAIKEFLPSGLAVREAGSVSVFPSGAEGAADFRNALARFEDEARTLVALRHPNVVEVQRYIEANGTAYVVMKFEEGRSLSELLDGGKTLSASDLQELAHPLLDGLEIVHRKNYLHRDIKPANIYIREADSSPVLLDFGAARQAMGADRRTSLTEIVTPGYAPFEQYFRKGEQGPWTDIYALGATFYRCIVGQPPPEAPERVRKDPMVPAVEAGKGKYPEALLAAVDAMLHVDERKRPQTVAEVSALLGVESATNVDLRVAESTLVVGRATPTPAPDLAKILRAAEQGDPDAQNELGDRHRKGIGVAKNVHEAVRWYRKAAEQGHPRGQCNLGAMFWGGLGVPQDYSSAVTWWRRAAEQGDPNAQRRLGDAHVFGQGVPFSYEEASVWYRRAAEQGDSLAKLNLAYVSGLERR